jgi:hypothetical protein
MPIRFSTEAANADVLGEDTKIGATPDATPRGNTRRRTSPDRFERPSKAVGKAGEAPVGNAKPGKHVQAPGADVKPGKDIEAPGGDVKPGKDVEAPGGDVKPGKDINAPGFIKDKDAAKP